MSAWDLQAHIYEMKMVAEVCLERRAGALANECLEAAELPCLEPVSSLCLPVSCLSRKQQESGPD